ncbi:toll/interleukin-1 receptor domain-containing protein [Helicobacter pylori]|uniref:toll/interleukin-1 receptor domain-containing protein n=1 Tax=Helicobacter pylori TaxID=210 RepID=UPI000992C99E|nr:toll/interleukin-1 receptor domain-containing protein [Helicobacter pylori]MBM0609108.1 toll/interleukin-1 receptor domain-containing protein [Helicobacter pylori]MBS3012821.1 toll/interleukin-1 receptor domain-containing protein [Helicobacter pylori]MBS3014305.1 toll/interleukin-1 receptor domain-containing protein [Helicobacter pylori]MBS3015759.1 toll/interleukin-1 receptor domain-containing protein [Helicobacter pylori]OOP75990.1 TIR domain protein [Helicobacter pylori]
METYIIDTDNIDGDLFFYNLTRNSNDFSMLPVFELDHIAQKIRNILKKHGSRKDIILKRNEIKEAFFSPFKPQLKNAQVFLSHSHVDINKALEVKDYLENQTKRKVFVDSLFWDYKDDVLNKLAEHDDISRIEDAFTLILRESLQDMIEKCPYFVFLQSKNSVSLNQGLSQITYSAWIYEELRIANTFIADTALQESRIKAMCISYDVTNLLRRFKPISLNGLCNEIFSTLL